MKVSTKLDRLANDGFKVIVLIITIALLRAPNLHAQKNDIKFEHISLEQGLSQASVFCILQDSRGFMWFGTEDGLNKYDGYSFTVYKPDPDNFNSLSDNYVKSIYEDKSGTLWIGTGRGGLNKFDRAKEQFSHYQHDATDPNSLSHNSVWSIYEDKSGTLWIGTYGGGLNKFDRAKKQFSHYQKDANDPYSLSHNYVMSICEDKSGTLWIGTGGGVNRFDRKKEQFSHYMHDPNNPNSLSHRTVYSIYEDKSETLWIGTYDGLNKFDRAKEQFSYYHRDANDPNSLSDNSVMSIYEDKSGTLWIGTYGGLSKFDRAKEHFSQYQHDANDPNSLSHNYIRSIYEDKSGILWIGTGSGGLNKFARAKEQFSQYQHDANNPSVYSIYEDKSGTIWIGTVGGLNKFDRAKEQFSQYQHDANDPNSLSDNYIRSIYEDKSGTLWIGTYDGFNKFDREKEHFSHYQHDPNDPNSLSYGSVSSIYEDKSGILWIGTIYGGLNKFDREKEHFSHYQHDPDDPTSLSNNDVRLIYEDPDEPGVLWIGTLGGLNKFDREKETFKHYKHDPGNPRSLSHNSVWSFYEDRSGVFWIGTPGGLNQFDRASESFKHYREKDGLPNDVINGILEDDQGHLWLSTNKGLAKLNPESEIFRNYDVSDGLQSNEFNAGAHCKSRSGELFFGGINGFNAFYPDSIKDNPHVPPIVVTDFQIFNKSVPIFKGDSPGERPDSLFLDKHITETNEIILSYQESVFSFEFAALSYALPERNQYAYMMEGFDGDWVYSDNRRFATYTNLDPGDYIFRIKGSNKDGVWNEAGTSIRITITPPFWQTWWFRILVAVSALALAFGWYRRRIGYIEAQKQKLEIQVTKRTAELSEEITERKQAEKALKYRSEIECIISMISTSFINLEPDGVDEAINHALLTLGAFAEVDRSYVFLFSQDGKTFSNTHERCAEGIESSVSSNLDLPVKNFPCVMKRLKQFEVFYVPRVADLPPEERMLKKLLKQHGVQSLIDVPMVSGKRLVGFLGLDAVRTQKEWSEEDIRMLNFVAEIFVNALERRRAEKELRKTQAQLVQSEKMAALGKLTAGISHEINTPVGVVKSTMDTLTRCGDKIDEILERSNTLKDLKENSDYQKALEILKSNRLVASSATDRILKMVTSLKNFVQLDEAELKKFDLHVGLDSTLTLIQPEFKDETSVIKDYGELPQVYGYPAEINQVLMTILRNASQAIEGVGNITIKTFADESNVHVKVTDTGKGMPSERVETLFDLNFTTNGSRVGMGMGLFNAYNTIQKHNGEINVESKVDKGTAFSIILPTRLERTLESV